jgi:hypothetical protein
MEKNHPGKGQAPEKTLSAKWGTYNVVTAYPRNKIL